MLEVKNKKFFYILLVLKIFQKKKLRFSLKLKKTNKKNLGIFIGV